jgi:hypothetical protein
MISPADQRLNLGVITLTSGALFLLAIQHSQSACASIEAQNSFDFYWNAGLFSLIRAARSLVQKNHAVTVLQSLVKRIQSRACVGRLCPLTSAATSHLRGLVLRDDSSVASTAWLGKG